MLTVSKLAIGQLANTPKLFCDTQAGANASVIIFTLLEIAKANGLNPESYLNHLLTVLPERFAADPLAVTDECSGLSCTIPQTRIIA